MSELETEFSPDWAVLPGEILQKELNARGLTQAELAARTNLSTKHINQVIKGVASLSSDTALRLERTLGIPSHFWNRLEARYQDHRMRERAREDLARNTSWLNRFPLPELIARNVLAKEDGDLARIEKLLTFFQVADPEAYDKVWTEPVAAGFRRAQHLNVDPYATAVWLRLGERAASSSEAEPYDAVGFSNVLPTLRELTRQPDGTAFRNLQRACAAVGVIVVFEPEIKGCRACGAARWMSATKAMILLSGRHQYHDIFWFSFFHEAAHLLLHPKRKTVVDLEGGDDADGQEGAANEYAASMLIPAEYSHRLTRQTSVDEARHIAHEIGVHPGVIAGRLGHRYGTWPRWAKLRRKLAGVPAVASQ